MLCYQTFKKVSRRFASPADIPLEMQQFLETRFATYYAILEISTINISCIENHSILILCPRFWYFYTEYLVIFSRTKSVQITEIFIFLDFSKFFTDSYE